MSGYKISELKEQAWADFFEDRPPTWEKAYQAFEARRKAEGKEDENELIPASEAFGPKYYMCHCPDPHDYIGEDIVCRWHNEDGICNHPSNKPPEPECGHAFKNGAEFLYKTYGDKYCRDCGMGLNV